MRPGAQARPDGPRGRMFAIARWAMVSGAGHHLLGGRRVSRSPLYRLESVLLCSKLWGRSVGGSALCE